MAKVRKKRKTEELAEALIFAKARAEELEKLAVKAKEEEQALISKTKEEIQSICDKNNFFCGIKLTTEDLISVIRMAIINKDDTVDIPFHLYFKVIEEEQP